MDLMTNWVASMALTFFCNSMVEELYYMGENKSVSEKLKGNCQRAIAELDSLKWPHEKPYLDIKTDLFNTNYNINTFEQICEHYRKPAGQMVNDLITDLKYVISDTPIRKKMDTAHKLHEFFDNFGDCGFYATKDCSRC